MKVLKSLNAGLRVRWALIVLALLNLPLLLSVVLPGYLSQPEVVAEPVEAPRTFDNGGADGLYFELSN